MRHFAYSHSCKVWENETKEWKDKMGRWSREAIEGISDSRWWLTVAVCNRAREPWDHFRNWLDEVNATPTGPRAVALLVWGKATEFEAEFCALADESRWEDLIHLCPSEHEITCRHAILEFVQRNAAAFAMRVLHRLRSYPECLLMLAVAEPTKPVRARAKTTNELISASVDDLDTTAAKVVRHFKAELETTAKDGTVDFTLYTIIRMATFC